jgi:uncharacterized protein YhaN
MNIRRLDLIAFGPFAQQSLRFEQPQPGLHLVFGHNEAGKSSCRRAIGQWLFGIPHKSTDNFRHESSRLRIGGELSNGAGQTLEFIRKKGRKDTLRTIDDATTLATESLGRFLGGLDANTFSQRFSLDHQELLAGGQALGSGSELGEVLFAAGAGIADIRAIQSTLQNRARELFLAGGSVPKINELLRQLTDAKTTQKNLMLSAASWMEIESQLRQAQERNVSLENELLGLRRELRLMERLQRAIPLVTRWRAGEQTLKNLAHAPRLPEDVSQRRIRAQTAWSAATKAVLEVEQRIATLTVKLQSVQVSPELLQLKTLIRSLHARLSSIQKATQDRARLIAELRVAETQFAECQREWEDFGGDPNAASLQIGTRLRSRLQSLAAQHASLSERSTMCQATTDQLERELAKTNPCLDVPTHVSNIEHWQRSCRALTRFADQEERANREAQQQSANSDRLIALMHSLPLGPHTLESIVAMPLPLSETIEKFLHDDSEIEKATELAQAKLDRICQTRQDVERELKILQRTEQVPTEAELTTIREQRNRAWEALGLQRPRSNLTDNHVSPPSTNPDTIPGQSAETTADQFWSLTLAADGIADRLRREAGRVAQLAQLLVDFDNAEGELHRCADHVKSLQRKRELWNVAWSGLWKPCQLEPLSPREMLSWLRRCQELRQAVHADREQQLRCEHQLQEISTARQSAYQLTRQMGLAEPLPSENLAELLQRVEQQLQILSRAEQQREQQQQRRSDLQRSLADSHLALKSALEAQQAWQHQWAEARNEAGLHEELVAQDLHVMLEKFDRWQTLGKELAKHRQRIAGIDRDQAAFETEVAPLRALEARAASLRPEETVALLYDQLTRCEQELTRKEQWQAQLESEQEERNKQIQETVDWDHELQRLCMLANCETVEALAIVEKDALQRLEVERELAEAQRQLLELADSEDLASFISQVEGTDLDNVAWQIEKLHQNISTVDTQRTNNSELIGRLKRELERMDGNAAAAQAQEDVAQGVAAIQHHAQHYIHLRLAAGILGRVIDRYRQANQGGILERAGQLFSELTLDSFVGVHVDVQDNGALQLFGVRPDNRTFVSTGGMSEGSCDQLYLAFRIALLEAFLERNAPVPLLVDDLLITFDDRRSVAALRVLAKLGRQTQVIFFTHHYRLVELAQQHLARELYSVQTLDTA